MEIASLSPANTAEKMQLHDEINKLRKDKQYLTTQLNTTSKNNKDPCRGYFPYTEVTKKIYNCISIQEISQLRNLFRRNKWDEIIKSKNIAVILRLIVGVDNDAIPICNPQTSSITSEQRELTHTLKTSSPSDALNIIRSNRSSIESLFKILDQSLRMMVNLFNKYGSIDENSDTKPSDDDYSGNTDESGDETQDENSDAESSDNDYSGNTDESGDENQDENSDKKSSDDDYSKNADESGDENQDENSDKKSSDDDYSKNSDESGDETQDENSDTESSDDDYGGNTDESGYEAQNKNTTRDGTSYMITDEIINESMVDIPESGSDTIAYSTEDDRNS